MNLSMDEYTAFIFDLDGCIYSGNTVYPAAKELLDSLMRAGKHVLFLSNNSWQTSDTIRKKLLSMGLPVERAPILATTELVGQYLMDKYGALQLQAVGSEELKKCLQQVGHRVFPLGSQEKCDVLVVGLDQSFTYQKLCDCSQKLAIGGKLVVTNLDFYHPGEGGHRIPETGAFVEAIKAVAGISEVESIGKPAAYSFEMITKQIAVGPEACVMVGDNPYTDMQGAHAAGMFTVWISHGNKFPRDAKCKPDIVVNTIGELLDGLMNSNKR
ncbi:Acid sugar phosphatase [Sporomusa silvacetica DSM 10669]|uniref:Acid sugar phosphatase n=1 Tax=Sporomusa silvacetica DSM 10669 TaxID=1123289 RepID=A0ABZ3IJJ3_9FIRM|nr:putative hydrolase YutF [Sporomusa silvacetica DSM 10669]